MIDRRFMVERNGWPVYFETRPVALAYARDHFPDVNPRTVVQRGPDHPVIPAQPSNYYDLDDLAKIVDSSVDGWRTRPVRPKEARPVRKPRAPRKKRLVEQEPSPFPDMMTAGEAALYLGITAGVFHAAVQTGMVPPPVHMKFDGVTRTLFYKETIFSLTFTAPTSIISRH